MPAYNTEKYIGQAIESIINQTYTNFEFLIIDDGSTDNTWNIISKYANEDHRIITFRNEKNIGYIKSQNFGLKRAKGELITKMDNDDYCDPTLFEKLFSLLRKSQADICFSNVVYVDEEGEELFIRKYDIKNINATIRIESPASDPNFLMEKRLFDEYGDYNEKYVGVEDYELWIRLWNNNCQFAVCEETLYYYRQHPGSIKQTKTKTAIFNSIKLKLNAMKTYGMTFGLSGWIRIFLEMFLLLTPTSLILKLFYLRMQRR